MTPYLWVLVLAVALPLPASFWPPLGFWRHRRELLCSIVLIVALFGGWDVWATFRGHWRFDPSAVLPIRIINLPLEEVLFFVVVPFCCIFTWEAMLYLKKRLP